MEPIMQVKLVVVRGRPHGKCLLFPRGEFVIGRGHECHIRPNSDWVSRQHCLLRVTAEAVSLRDLGSTNGTLVNGVRVIGERALTHGDQLQVGPMVFEVRLDEPLPTPPTAPAAPVADTETHFLDTALVEALKDDVSAPPRPEEPTGQAPPHSVTGGN
jgi:pSer/pThr/pTyr-binding forkhead associated (FHA) protein